MSMDLPHWLEAAVVHEASIASNDAAFEFELWAKQAKPGARIVYWEGHLAREGAGRKVGQAALKAAATGWFTLAQRRLEPGRYRYIAVRRETRDPFPPVYNAELKQISGVKPHNYGRRA